MPVDSKRPVELPLVVEVVDGPDAAVVRCRGILVIGETDALRDAVKSLLPKHKKVVIDLSAVTAMDSSGLGAIVRLYVSAKSAKTELQVVNLTPRIRQLFSITHLLTLFEPCSQVNIRLP